MQKYLSARGEWEPCAENSDESEPILYCPICESLLSVHIDRVSEEEYRYVYKCTNKKCVECSTIRRTGLSALGIVTVYPQPHKDKLVRLVVRMPSKLSQDVSTIEAPIESWADNG